VIARHDGYLMATCYDSRRNRTIVAIVAGVSGVA
jgi:hypothetical protein